MLDDLRVTHGRLDNPVPIGDSSGTLHVELNHSDLVRAAGRLPRHPTRSDNDSRILAVARNLSADGRDVVLVSKDMPMRVKAASVGIPADEYRAQLARRLRLDRDGRARRRRERRRHAVLATSASTCPPPPTCPATPGCGCSRRAARRSAG